MPSDLPSVQVRAAPEFQRRLSWLAKRYRHTAEEVRDAIAEFNQDD